MELAGELHLAGASTFVLDTVVPQFGLVPHRAASESALGRLVGDRLLAESGGQVVDVAYDYDADFELLEHVLGGAGMWDQLKRVFRPTRVGYLMGEADVEAAMEMSWTASFVANGIGRHHALADARALRAGHVTVHGGDLATNLGCF